MDNVSQALKVAQLKSKLKKGSVGNVKAKSPIYEAGIDTETQYIAEPMDFGTESSPYGSIGNIKSNPRIHKAGIPDTTSDPRIYKAGIDTESEFEPDEELMLLQEANKNMIKKTNSIEEDKKKLNSLTPVLDYLNKR